LNLSAGHVGSAADKAALGQVFSVYIGFPYQFLFHQMLHTHLSSGAGTIAPSVTDVPSGLTVSPHPKTLKKLGDSQLTKKKRPRTMLNTGSNAPDSEKSSVFLAALNCLHLWDRTVRCISDL
jgi:hypothetical protein